MAQLVIPVRSTFQNDLHGPIGGPHPVPYFTTQITKKYCTAMCYIHNTDNKEILLSNVIYVTNQITKKYCTAMC